MTLAPFTPFRNCFLQDHIVTKPSLAAASLSEIWRLAAGG
jgi:hypothetical protein